VTVWVLALGLLTSGWVPVPAGFPQARLSVNPPCAMLVMRKIMWALGTPQACLLKDVAL